MTIKKHKVELITYSICTFLTVSGAVLCFTGLMLPNWYEYKGNTTVGIVETHAKLGLWQDEICDALSGCNTYWLTDDGYERPQELQWPSWKLIQVFETVATALSVCAVLALVPLWAFFKMGSSEFFRNLTYIVYYVCAMVAAFLAVVGCLVVASKTDKEYVDFAPFLPGAGGCLLFISACMGCVVCRYDPSYGTLGNPVSPTFMSA